MESSTRQPPERNEFADFLGGLIEKAKFKVIIVGAGVAGLTLANSLQRMGMDYVVLEARDEIAPQVGASICLGPSSLRILDQLGLCDQITEQYEPIHTQHHWKDGKCFNSDSFYLMSKARWGYDICCFDRQILLRILYGGISDKTKVKTGKRVVRIDHSVGNVVVECDDGSMVTGDVVVGLDGIYSTVRKEMWRHANLLEPGTISQDEQTDIKAEYNCLFGISKNVAGVPAGAFNRVYSEDTSAILLAGKDDKVHWFFFTKLDKVYHVPNIPRYTNEEAEVHVGKFVDWRFTDRVTLADLWENRSSWSLACIEEFFLDHWAWGRFVCLGDSVHKSTPNAGLGGTQAIESCAALANSLHELRGQNDAKHPSFEEVKAALTSVQKKRQIRTAAAVKASNELTRLEALQGLKAKIMMLHVIPRSGDYLINRLSYSTVGAEKLQNEPDPERSYSGFARFNPNYGLGKAHSRFRRAQIAFPLLFIGYNCWYLFSTIKAGSRFKAQHPWNGEYLVFSKTSPIPFYASYCGVFTSCDRFLKIFVSTFSPSVLKIDTISYYQSLSFLTDVMPLLMIWNLESYRCNNAITFARFPIIFALLTQLFGVGAIGPVYFFLHYVQSPLEKFIAKDQRMINIAYASTAFPALITAYGIPHWLQFFASSSMLRLQANALWQPFPLILTLTHWAFTAIAVKDTTEVARRTNPSADMKHIRLAILATSVLAASAFNYVRFTSGYSFRELFVPCSAFLTDPLAYPSTVSFLENWRLFLQLDELSGFLAAFAWLGLLFWDLMEAEMLQWGWIEVVVPVIVATVVAGPGAVIGVVWLCREEALNGGEMKGAVVKPRRWL